MTNETTAASGFPGLGSAAWLSRRSFLSAGAMTLALQAAKLRAESFPLPGYPPLDLPCLAASRTLYPSLLEGFISKLDPASDSALYRKHNAGNSFYRNNGDSSFADRSAHAGSARAGWAWSSAS